MKFFAILTLKIVRPDGKRDIVSLSGIVTVPAKKAMPKRIYEIMRASLHEELEFADESATIIHFSYHRQRTPRRFWN